MRGVDEKCEWNVWMRGVVEVCMRGVKEKCE